jgi:bacteriochlorophyll 4-vinyl reductase
MVDAGIGRLLVASLHQGIADIAPERLPFYENWLKPPGLRDGKFGLAALHAVLSFLRLEGQHQYEQIMTRAGEYTADWGQAEQSSFERHAVRRLPTALRARAALYLSGRLVKRTFRGSRAHTRLRRGIGTVEIRASIFCDVRATTDWPMCVFYAAVVERFLRHCEVDARVTVDQCRASGGAGCTMKVTIRGQRAEHPAAEAA